MTPTKNRFDLNELAGAFGDLGTLIPFVAAYISVVKMDPGGILVAFGTLIETHLRDMLRVAVSIKLGKISASAILRRLATYSRKNKLYLAFRELGKVERTMFLLNYIGDVELRKVIHAETNKSEQFNAFAKWSFFGGQGIIAENIRHEQRKVIKYNHLVANLIILHNVDGMTRVLKTLKEEGVEVTPEVLAGLAPYRIAHINRYGDYTLDFRRKVGPMLAGVSIIPNESIQ